MIAYETTNKMYEMFLEKKELTTQELLSLGFTSKDLKKLVDENKLRRVKRGYYDLENYDGLLSYARMTNSKNIQDFEKGQRILQRCLEIDPTSTKIHINMLLTALHNSDYETALKSFEVLDQETEKKYKQDANLWLFLLSYIIEVSEEQKKRVENMKLDDILTDINDIRYETYEQDKLREMLFQQRFTGALYLNSQIEQKNQGTKITEILTRRAAKKLREQTTKINNLIKEEKYQEAKEILEKIDRPHGMSNLEQIILYLTTTLINIIERQEIPPHREHSDADTFFDIILKNNFELAMKIHTEKKLIKPKKDIIELLLERIIAEIEKIRNKYIYEEEKLEQQMKTPTIEEQPQTITAPVIEETKEQKKTISMGTAEFIEIINLLTEGNIDKALELLETYLTKINQKEYRHYIANLIKLDLLNKDKSYTETLHELSCIGREKPIFDVVNYIQDYYFSLINKDYKKAAIYLNIINIGKILENIELNTNEMKATLIEESFKNRVKEKDLGLLTEEELLKIRTLKETKEGPVITQVEISSIENVPPRKEKTQVIPETVKEEQTLIAEEKQDIEEKEPEEQETKIAIEDAVADILDGENVLMLDPKNTYEMNRIRVYIDQVNRSLDAKTTIQLSEIESNNKVIPVLRYICKKEYVDISKTLQLANEKYKNWEYEDAIELYQTVLPVLNEPKSFIYANLAFAYQRTTYDGNYQKAITYFTLAMEQSKKEEFTKDFSNIIKELKQKMKRPKTYTK